MPPKSNAAAPVAATKAPLVTTLTPVKAVAMSKSNLCYLCGKDRRSWKLMGGSYNGSSSKLITDIKSSLPMLSCETCYRKAFLSLRVNVSPTIVINLGIAVFPSCRIQLPARRASANLSVEDRKKEDARKALNRLSSKRGESFKTMTKFAPLSERKKMLGKADAPEAAEPEAKRYSVEKREKVDNFLKNRVPSVEDRTSSGQMVKVLPGPGKTPPVTPPVSPPAPPEPLRSSSSSKTAPLPPPAPVEEKPKEEGGGGWFSGWFGGGKKKEEKKKKEEHNLKQELETKLNAEKDKGKGKGR
jgi:hypothetical protein